MHIISYVFLLQVLVSMHKKMQQDNIIYEGGAVRNAWILFDFREVSGSI